MVLRDMHKLRAKVFKDRMGWKVQIRNGMEIDLYDAIDPHYMVIQKPNGETKGCLRLLPTEGSYMLKDSFPELLHGHAAPKDARIWELSRFAIETDGRQAFGFSRLTMAAFGEIIAYGHGMNLDQYVTVTTTAIERLLRHAGFKISRIGPPIRIGVENAVAIYVDIDKTYAVLFDGANRMT